MMDGDGWALVGPAAFKAVVGRADVSGVFDSHTSPPVIEPAFEGVSSARQGFRNQGVRTVSEKAQCPNGKTL